MTARRVLSVTDPLCQLAMFMRPDGSAQAAITSNNLRAAVVEIPAPSKGERIVMKRMSDGCVEIFYEDETLVSGLDTRSFG